MMPKTNVLAVVLLSSYAFLCLGQEQQLQLKVVKGMPFSAKVVTESNQTLVDGNHIVRKGEAQIARDNDGRTRREQKPIIFVQDPVSGISYVLDTQAASVRKIPVQMVESVEPPVKSIDAESLGTQFIDGFLTEGTRLRKTIPADKAGSDRPIEVISETWYSPQLQMIVMKKTIDPRFGEVNYKLIEIELGEPAQSLFEVPKEYTAQIEAPKSR